MNLHEGAIPETPPAGPGARGRITAMKLLHRKPVARRGFTLIELLVVIAVIALLVALTAAAVMNLFSKGPATQDRADISAMTVALQQFKAKYGSYPPSRIRLYASASSYKPANQTHKDTLTIIGKMFPNISWNNIDWTGNNNPAAFLTNYPKGVLLEGDQCLVFFLGGIPSPSGGLNGCTGFSKSTTNPAQPGGERLKFYDFQPARLTTAVHANNPFYSYVNAHNNRAYVYFSTGTRQQNGYNSVATGTGKTDCATLGVNPYASTWPPATALPTFINPDSFQLISAGADGNFGPGTTSTGTVWAPNNVAANLNGPGTDDISNFSDRILGATQ
jgi:prepilin-type N-terminal cleavage/methylation domain-containing protein